MVDFDRLLTPDIARAASEVAEPPDFAAIERRGTRRRRTHAALVTAAAAAAVAIALAGASLVGVTDSTAPPPVHQPPSTPQSVPKWHTSDGASHVPIEAGTYVVPSDAWSVTDFTVTIPEGWTVQYGFSFARHGEEQDEFGFRPAVVEEIYADACRGERGDLVEVGPSARDLVDALLEQTGPTKHGPVDTTLGGRPATRVDLRIPRRIQDKNCFLGPGTGLQIWYSRPADDYFVLLPGAVASVYVLEVHGQSQVFVTQVSNPSDRPELQTVLDSIRIEE